MIVFATGCRLRLAALITASLLGLGGCIGDAPAAIAAEGSLSTKSEALEERAKSSLAADELTDDQALAYIASHVDLIAAFGTNTALAKAHYAGSGRAEGRAISFNALRYIASYPDLITVFGLDTETATRQFIRSGAAQGRTASFDGLRYIASNLPALGPLGVDTDAAARHYITAGHAAGWRTNFSPLQYIASFADLITAFGLDTLRGVTHYIQNGYAEGRVATFNAAQYLLNYPDLRAAFGGDESAATVHFVSNGIREGRTDAAPNLPPIARISSPAQAVVPIGATLTLNGASSQDPEGRALSYQWALRSKPANSTAQLGSPSSATPALSPDVGGTYVIELQVSDGTLPSSVASVAVRAGTAVAGTLPASTFWNASMSPIVLTGRVAIPSGAVLTIGEGVEVVGDGYRFEVAGALRAMGSPSSKIKLDNVTLVPLGLSRASPHLIQLSFVEITGSVYATTGSAIHGNLIIEDSRLNLNDYILLWYPIGHASIQRNYFVSGRISFGFSAGDATVTIKNNSFPAGSGNGQGAYYGDALENWASYGGLATVALNTFRSTAGVAMSVTADGRLDASANYWSTTDPTLIASMVFDRDDTLTRSTLINVTPFLSAPDPATPLQ